MSRSEILKHRPLRALLVAEVISTTGAQITTSPPNMPGEISPYSKVSTLGT